MLKKKKLEKKKLDKIKNQKFIYYYYDHSFKSDKDYETLQFIEKINIKKKNLPSAFKIETLYDVQGPSVSVFYSSKFKFQNLEFLIPFKALAFKWEDRWYSEKILDSFTSFDFKTNCSFLYEEVSTPHIEIYFVFESSFEPKM